MRCIRFEDSVEAMLNCAVQGRVTQCTVAAMCIFNKIIHIARVWVARHKKCSHIISN